MDQRQNGRRFWLATNSRRNSFLPDWAIIRSHIWQQQRYVSEIVGCDHTYTFAKFMRFHITEKTSELCPLERFCVVFSCPHVNAENDGSVNWTKSGQSKSLISTVIFMLENWVQHRFQKSPFSSVHTKTKHFQNCPLSKAFSNVSVFSGNDSTHSSFTCGWKAKTDKKMCVFPTKMHTYVRNHKNEPSLGV